VLGNKWVEIAKSLPGRNDNSVKNYFYSSIRKYIRKIAKGRISAEQKTSQLSKNLSIYFTQYIRRMYSDYLSKVAIKKQNLQNTPNTNNGVDVDMQTDEQKQKILNDYELEETKEEKAKSMKTGEKYIIRKLISFKTNVPKIDDYLQKLNSLQVVQEINPMNTYNSSINNGGNTEHTMNTYSQPMPASQMQNMNDTYFNQVPQSNYNTNPYKTFQGYNDDSQIAYQTQNMLYQQQMSQPNPYSPMQNQLLSQMQRLNLNNPNM
jgi:hypothetical protein